MNHKIVMNIGREFGSGGREIGKLAADKLGIPYYDKKLVALAAARSGLHPEYVSSLDEKSASSFFYFFAEPMPATGKGSFSGMNFQPPADRLFLAQSEVIRDIAENGGAVIVGRCADYVLQLKRPLLNVFIQAPLESKIQRVMARHDLDEKGAAALIAKTDKQRAGYYLRFTGEKWGDRKRFHLVISSAIGPEETADMIADYYLHAESALEKREST
jgi:hypothetical protein